VSLVAQVMHAARTHGAEDIRVLIARPDSAGSAFRPPEQAAFDEGQPFTILLAASWERYWSESVRTFQIADGRFGLLTDSGADERFRTFANTLRPGTSTLEWTRDVLDSMNENEALALTTFGIGHGIGVTPCLDFEQSDSATSTHRRERPAAFVAPTPVILPPS
jgi:hypothetical protein